MSKFFKKVFGRRNSGTLCISPRALFSLPALILSLSLSAFFISTFVLFGSVVFCVCLVLDKKNKAENATTKVFQLFTL